MRWMRAVIGRVLIVAGLVATVTGQFGPDSSWVLALGFALAGLVGLIANSSTSPALAE